MKTELENNTFRIYGGKFCQQNRSSSRQEVLEFENKEQKLDGISQNKEKN